jgi:type III restriction enzyme
MLTEGWDANTVTHILGVRAFGTQLLCEQVVGRGLRRVSYVADEHGMFAPEYAEVYGVPFSFIPTSGSAPEPKPGLMPTRVRALEERAACEIAFPRLIGYRYDLAGERLSARFSDSTRLTLSTADIPSWTENAPIVGEASIHKMEDLREQREQTVAFELAKLVLEIYFRDAPDGERWALGGSDAPVKAWLFPQVLDIARRWLAECVVLKDNTFPQLLLLAEKAHAAAERIYDAIVSTDSGARTLKPILRPYDTVGSTRHVDFDTTKAVYQTDPAKCHVSYVVADTGSWEQKLAQTLEQMPEVVAYVKNQNLGFSIPYTIDGGERRYIPDFIARVDDGRGPDDLLNLIVEVSGFQEKDKATKVATAGNLWVPAVNNHGGFGRWAFIEITDPWNAENTIRSVVLQAMEIPG